ncbi:glycosyltransferase [Candidatus Methylomirabilis sp.]|uniref:glycosyltransferase n=1 Tax=Candidatus Methylomirabilis sp. TaxID=2032687 RepID=UPI0030765F93
MRLLLVVHGFPPQRLAGTELYTYALAQELRSRGHDVCVLYPDYSGGSEEGTIVEERYEGLEVARIHVRPADLISQFNNERLLPPLRQYVSRLRPDLVHIQHLIGVSAAAVQVFREQGLPSVMTMHDGWLICEQCHFLQPHGVYCKDGPETVDKCVQCLVGRYGLTLQSEQTPKIFYTLALRRQCLEQTVRSIDTIIVPSKFMRQMLSRHRFEHPRVTLSPLGLPTFDVLPWIPRTDRLRFTFLGNICFTKGVDLAIHAFNRIDPKTARLDLYGQVQDPAYFRRVMTEIEPRHQVTYHGAYSPADLARILADTDVAVIPSRSEHYPCIVRECLHAGVPVITSNVGGIPEIIQDGENGLLFEAGDSDDLAKKLRVFVSDPNRVTTFRRSVRSVSTIRENADQLEIIYRDALTRRSCAETGKVTGAQTSRVDISAWLRRADECAAREDWASAHDALREAHDQAQDDPQIIVALGNVALRLGNVEAARREFVKATVLAPDYAPAHGNLAAVLLRLGCAEEAEASARRALALNPHDTDVLKVLARVCLDSERYTEAVQAYSTILQENPNDVETLLVVGNCYAEAGRPEDAKRFYQRVLQLNSGNTVAAENLAAISGNRDASDSVTLRADRLSKDPETLSGARSISHEPLVSIVIVTYNSVRTIRACLESVFSSTRSPLELIVVDNASTDATRAVLAEYQGRITVLVNAENAGFSRGCNQGIRASAGQHVVLLNPDTVVTSGWLERLLSHASAGVGAVGPVSDYVAGLQKFHLYLPAHRPATMTLAELADLLGGVNQGKAVETKLLIGFCMLVPRKVLDEVGLLDEDLFLGNDDLDLSWRLRLRGYRLLVATDAFVHHEGQVSFKSEAETKTSRLVQESTDRLYANLVTHYGPGNVPSPMELWGIDWFKPTAASFRVRAKVMEGQLTSIIILTHNGLEHTRKCLASIEAHTPELHELVIVDNGSDDGTIEYLRSYMAAHDNVRVIANRSNRGFAAGNNQGLALARGDYLLLLNNDTIVTIGWLQRMLQVFLAHPDVGIVGPMSNYVSGPQLVREVSYKGPEGLEAFAVKWAQGHDGQSAEATRVVGFCLLTRKEVIARIGGLDEQFGSGNFEDDDFCIRAFQVGFRARIALDAFIHHTGSQTFKSAKIDYRQSLMRNWELFKAKWDIPADAPYEKGYRFPAQTARESNPSIPLPDVGADHWCEDQSHWWQETCGEPVERIDKVVSQAQPAVTGEAPLSVVIVSNGHGLAPLWPSLVQHAKHPLAITILPSHGNGNGAEPAHEAVCPGGWRIGTSNLPTVRLLNQLLESVHDDPVILLSSDLILTPGWLKRLLAAFDRDRRIAVVGPTLNQGPATQRVKADYKGTGKALRQFALRRAHRYGEKLAEVDNLAPFCTIFKGSTCRAVEPLREDLDLSTSLHDYFARLRQAGCTVAVALDAYVHYEPPADLPSRGPRRADADP